ncbi:MAG: spore coat protein CotJB [Clostridia bacterium]|nr:spore coat protein CotJB [Clostridia bacterium]
MKIPCRNLINELYGVSFAVDDVTLFLDTHPGCEKALECFDDLKKIERSLEKEINSSCFALTAADDKTEGSWGWICGPWPWEGAY